MTLGTPWMKRNAHSLPGNKYLMDNSGLEGLGRAKHDLNNDQIEKAHREYLRDMEKPKPEAGYTGRLRSK